MTRDRFLANALVPAAWVMQAQRVRHWFARRVARVFETVDVLLAPATPCVAPTDRHRMAARSAASACPRAPAWAC